MELASTKIRGLCKAISRFTGEQSAANGYIAFGEDEALGKHWDTHDVFATQLKGRKRWLLYGSTFPLPLYAQKSTFYKSKCPAEPTFDIILEEGDILYIPRGCWHTALPLGEETFHLAIGIHGATFIDYIEYLLKYEAPNIAAFRSMARLNHQAGEELSKLNESLSDLILNEGHFKKFCSQRRGLEKETTSFDVGRHLKKEEAFQAESVFVFNSKTHPENLSGLTRLNSSEIAFKELEIHPSIWVNIFEKTVPIEYSEIVESLTQEEMEVVNQQLNYLLRNSIIDQLK